MPSLKPNIVYITSDELKASAVSSYGNADAHTPNIARLAGQGIQFNQAFTTFPKCVPARSALLTGRYPHVGGHRTLPGFEIRRGEPNLVSELKKLGYTAGLFGKNHWVEPELKDELFDRVSGPNPRKPVRKFFSEELDDPAMFRAMYRPEDYDGEELFDRYEVDQACRFIEDCAKEDKPFFLLMDISNPHPVYINIQPYIEIIRKRKPKLPPAHSMEDAPKVLRAYREIYDLEQLSENDWRKIVEAYYSMVSYADHCLGRVMEALDRAGVSDNTLVVFTSDHGDFAGEHGAVEKWDTMFYDCLVHVPLIMRLPGRIPAGVKTDALTDNVDNVPTIMELIGEEAPSWVQGESLVPVIDGKCSQHKSFVFCEGGVEDAALSKALHHDDEFYDTALPNYKYKQKVLVEHPWTMRRAKMIRNKKWKMVFRVDGSKELYDLENDPNELKDVSHDPKNRGVIHQLTEELLKWAIRTETALPEITDMRA